jgi:hypothetical protein
MTHRQPYLFAADAARSDALFARIRAAIEYESASRFRTGVRISIGLMAAVCVSTVITFAASQIVYQRAAPGLDSADPSWHLVSVFVLLVALTCAATFAAMRRGAHGFGSTARTLAVVIALVAPLYAGLTLLEPVHAFDAAPPVYISHWGYRCMLIAALVGGSALLSFAFALRRAVPAASGLRGAALGAVAGAWAGLSLFVFCASGEQQHLFFGHVVPIAAFTIIGAYALPRALRA